MISSFTIPEVLPVSIGVLLDGVTVAVPLAEVEAGEVSLVGSEFLPSGQVAVEVQASE